MKRLLAFALLLLALPALAQQGPVFSSRAVGAYTLGSFAPTTSAQLRGVLTDETGTGAAVFALSPEFSTSVGLKRPADGDVIGYELRNAAGTARGYLGLTRSDGTGWLSAGGVADSVVIRSEAGSIQFANGASLIGNINSTGFAPASATIARTTSANLTTWYVICQAGAAVSGAADTNENALATCTIPANSLGANGTLRVSTIWTHTNSGNNKVLRVRFGGASGAQYMAVTATTTATTVGQHTITNRNATNSQVGGHQSSSPIGASTGAASTSSVDTTAETTVVISCQKASGGETCTLERYMVELAYGA